MSRGEGSLGFDPSAMRTGRVDTHLEKERQVYIVSLTLSQKIKRKKCREVMKKGFLCIKI